MENITVTTIVRFIHEISNQLSAVISCCIWSLPYGALIPSPSFLFYVHNAAHY